MHLTTFKGRGGKVARPVDAIPEKTVGTPKSLVPGAKQVKIRYGPYSVHGPSTKSLMGEPGMLWNYPDIGTTKPCDECVLLNQQAGLEFMNGSNANIDSGLWLHHMVHFVEGPTRWDPTCYGHLSLPHYSVKTNANRAERWFSSGNERTFVPLDKAGADTKWGYALKPDDKFKFIVDLMNMNKETQQVWMTMTYEYLDGPLPAGWKDIKPVWLDIDQCSISEVPSPQDKMKFAVSSTPWTPSFEGQIVAVGGHMHDGGLNVEIMSSATDVACDSVTAYAESKEFETGAHLMSAGGGHSHGGSMKHISSMTLCGEGDNYKSAQSKAFSAPSMLKKDQAWSVRANYDYDKHLGEKDNGKWGDIMGIALLFVAVDPGLSTTGVSRSTAATDLAIQTDTRRVITSIAANVAGLGSILNYFPGAFL